MSLEVVQIPAGRMDNFSYLVVCPRTRRALAVDPSLAPENLLAEVSKRDLRVETLVNTHGHGDHTGGNAEVLRATGARLAAHPLDLPDADIALEEGSRLAVGEGMVEVLHTPGHSPGSITLFTGADLITGDTLFVTFVGRADLAGSNPEDLYRSLRRLASFPPHTRIYPGHDYGPRPVSTIGFELEHNPYLKCPDLAAFLKLRMG
ncbi:hydroxyacylglutathione hydrolase family protein [Geoalkalibacter halelectricus]|uniref:Hydroxyacylglutathione hydrolase family protein n=1 Tax=Geoalkalibacter halelectricus TaxID=2847045 RepID=A0ABY5ZM55_9BACT|nr:hydroxyacylglutathione hydrolase family protein [Geoalkalibacter halelectricus]MDO3378538.1 hydroxyacylglutathione hydrolase family protein [Geoalkalibacter halelectricus]UWZ80148.1 hydroxyacylglutathione hydrolase family protein [Geoalkalibacter halelectricus]